MTDAELDAIEERYKGAESDYYIGDCAEQILALVAEVRRLKAAAPLQFHPNAFAMVWDAPSLSPNEHVKAFDEMIDKNRDLLEPRTGKERA